MLNEQCKAQSQKNQKKEKMITAIAIIISLFTISLVTAIILFVQITKQHAEQISEMQAVLNVLKESFVEPVPMYNEGMKFQVSEGYHVGHYYNERVKGYSILKRYFDRDELCWKYILFDNYKNQMTVTESWLKKKNVSTEDIGFDVE